MLTISETLILQQLAIYADSKINKSRVSRETGVSRKTVRNVINRFKKAEINVKK